MAIARGSSMITALDIGSWKVCALIAELTEAGEMKVLGTGQRESKGVRRGYIADMGATEQAIREAVELAESIAETNIENVWVSFSAGGLVSNIASVEVELGGHRIEQSDVDDLLAAGHHSIDPEGRMVLHAHPTVYTIDNMEGVKNPLGLHADTLGVDIHVVSADASPVRNLDLCVRSAHLEVKSIVAAPVATGMACLSDEERELGVALVELGAGVTNISLFAGGMLVGLHTFPMGAQDITDDIASAFGTRRQQAERMKCVHGSATASPRDNHEMIDIAPLSEDDDSNPQQRVTKAQLITIIRERLDLQFNEITAALKTMGFAGPVGRQVVLTGGGSELKGIAEYAQSVMGRAVRTARPKGLLGMPDAHSGPGFATLAGLIHYAVSSPIDLRTYASDLKQSKMTSAGLFSRLISAIKTGY